MSYVLIVSGHPSTAIENIQRAGDENKGIPSHILKPTLAQSMVLTGGGGKEAIVVVVY
jgi:hypothetical protein